ncbi:MAG: iron-sulfur cluster assembly accessory protein [Rickettsiales bacterium]|nr:iron-sulfur cluster assembly accessory protein [Rickettsiales bacterium]|tara:strand:- start:876 stop:1292 length:417 start_codon:yes stop_codon:yes gene_type:complete
MSDCGNVQKVFVPSSEEETEQLETISGVEISERAAERIVFFCNSEKKDPAEFGLRVSVVKDGCSGNSYTMELGSVADAKEKGDKIFIEHGATVIVEKLSYLFVVGSRVDYHESLLASGFQLVNPNIKRSCSCGSSFAV